MGLDDFVSDEYAELLTDEDKRLIREFKLQEPTPTNRGGVYAIYHRETGEALYVGQTERLMRRISDHFRRTDGSQLLGLADEDDDIDIIQGTPRGRDGNIWEMTAVKLIEIESAEH